MIEFSKKWLTKAKEAVTDLRCWGIKSDLQISHMYLIEITVPLHMEGAVITPIMEHLKTSPEWATVRKEVVAMYEKSIKRKERKDPELLGP